MERQVVVEMVFGSHLYGTDTPESDQDFKGVILPTKREVLLGKIPNTLASSTGDDKIKNVKGDVDRDWYSLHYFIKLCCAGETVALDMLHAPVLLQSSDIWQRLISNRELFYTKSLKALLGYLMKQSARYGQKGSRINAMQLVLDALKGQHGMRLMDIWDSLPTGEHIHKLDDEPYSFYRVVGRKFVERMKVEEVHKIVAEIYEKYGLRAREAAENKNIDWKALSHAARAAMEIIEIFKYGTIIFPMKEADLLKDIKAGKLDYPNVVAPMLDDLIDECNRLSEASDLPEKVNRKFWDDFIVNVMSDYMGVQNG